MHESGFDLDDDVIYLNHAAVSPWPSRTAAAVCRFCDTEFVGTDGLGGGRFETAGALAETIATYWPAAGTGDLGRRCARGQRTGAAEPV